MEVFVIEGTFRIRVRPLKGDAAGNLYSLKGTDAVAGPNGAERRKRGRPSVAPQIIALLPDLARFAPGTRL
jgi:hypothetical protein